MSSTAFHVYFQGASQTESCTKVRLSCNVEEYSLNAFRQLRTPSLVALSFLRVRLSLLLPNHPPILLLYSIRILHDLFTRKSCSSTGSCLLAPSPQLTTLRTWTWTLNRLTRRLPQKSLSHIRFPGTLMEASRSGKVTLGHRRKRRGRKRLRDACLVLRPLHRDRVSDFSLCGGV